MESTIIIKSGDIVSNSKSVSIIIFALYFIFVMFGFTLNWLCGLLFMFGLLFIYPLCSSIYSIDVEVNNKQLIIKRGIFLKVESVIERDKIERVTITKDIFGLESLIVSTIGGKVTEIPYLKHANVYKEVLQNRSLLW